MPATYLKGQTFRGTQTIKTVTIYEDCIFDGGEALYAAKLSKDMFGRYPKGVRFVGCTFHNADKGLLGSFFSAQDCTFEDCANDGVFADGDAGDVRGCTFKRLGDTEMAQRIAAKKGSTYSPPHADGVQIMGFRHWRVVGNTFDLMPDAGHLTNSCVYVEAQHGNADDTVVRVNQMKGGNNCVWLIDNATAAGVQNRISPNVFAQNNQILAYRSNPIRAASQIPAANISPNDTSLAVKYT